MLALRPEQVIPSGVAEVRDVGHGGAVGRERNKGAEAAVGAAEDDEGWFGVFGVKLGEVGEDLGMELGGEGEEAGFGGHAVLVLVIEILIRVIETLWGRLKRKSLRAGTGVGYEMDCRPSVVQS